MAFFDALATVKDEREGEVPNAMRDATRDKKGFGHGAGYLYPHAYRDHWVAQQYLPGSLQGQVFYQPSDQGYEAQIQTQVARRREAQLAALVEQNNERSMPEALTYGTVDQQQDRWLQRATGVLGEQLGKVRDRIFIRLNPQRHHVLLDLNASTGLLTWEAVRRVPEGGVYSCARSAKEYEALVEQAEMLSELTRPIVLSVDDSNWLAAIEQRDLCLKSSFDGVIGRNVLVGCSDKKNVIEQIRKLLAPAGSVVLAESVPRRGQRLSQLIDAQAIEKSLYAAFCAAEDDLYNNQADDWVNWDIADLQRDFSAAGFVCEIESIAFQTQLTIAAELLERWLGEGSKYCDRLTVHNLLPAEIERIRQHFSQQLKNKAVTWSRTIAYIQAYLD